MASSAPAPFTGSFEDAVDRFEAFGFMLARLETLIRAWRDRRLPRMAGIVLSHLIETMNRETMTSYIGRDALAQRCGISAKSVSNNLWQLTSLCYIVSERRPTPAANNRVLLHYTLTALSPEEIEEAIGRAVASIRGEISTVVALPSSLPAGKCVPRPQGSEFPTGKEHVDEFPAGKEVSSLPAGCSNTTLLTTTVETVTSVVRASPSAPPNTPVAAQKRATRLPDDWKLPQAWGEWALEHFDVNASQVREQAERFRDHWHAKCGKDASKIDWLATWRNWCSSSFTGWKRKKVDAAHAPNLVDRAELGFSAGAKIRRF
jgi:hypothetical protein